MGVHQLEHRVEVVVLRWPERHCGAGASSSSASGSPDRSGSSRSGFGLRILAQTVDPDDLQSELARGGDVVEEARPDVNVVLGVGSRQLRRNGPSVRVQACTSRRPLP